MKPNYRKKTNLNPRPTPQPGTTITATWYRDSAYMLLLLLLPKNWVFFGRNDGKAETPILWPPHEKSWLTGKDWCWEELGAGGGGDDRGWDGWMASPPWWTWVWVNSRSWWWIGRPGVLRFMGSQRVGHNWATELNWLMMLTKTEKLIIMEKKNDSLIKHPKTWSHRC